MRDGIAEVVGVPRAVREAFSRRRAEIEAALEERGSSGAARGGGGGARHPARQGRRCGRGARSRSGARVRAELGFGREELRARDRAGATARRGTRIASDVWREPGRPAGLTRRSATFSRRDVIQALCEAGVGVATRRTLEAAADAFLRSDARGGADPGRR